MRILLLLTFFFYISLHADGQKKALQACEVFNNMKHTKNSGAHRLEEGSSYRVIREQGGQYYVTVPGISVPNRWVDKDCFDRGVMPPIQKSEVAKPVIVKKQSTSTIKQPKDLLLALSWHNAFCETHRYRKECRESRSVRYSDDRFVLHGLWPQPRNNLYCEVPYRLKQNDKNHQWNRLPRLDLSEETRRSLLRVMPGSASNLHRHEWVKHGTCSGSDPDSYFKEAISLTEQLNRSKVGRFFSENRGRMVTLQQIRFRTNESFGKGSGKRVEIRCKKGMITELWLHLGSGSDDLSTLLARGKPIRSRCQRGMIDRAGFR